MHAAIVEKFKIKDEIKKCKSGTTQLSKDTAAAVTPRDPSRSTERYWRKCRAPAAVRGRWGQVHNCTAQHHGFAFTT